MEEPHSSKFRLPLGPFRITLQPGLYFCILTVRGVEILKFVGSINSIKAIALAFQRRSLSKYI